jgi:hypothetical protein
MADSGTRTQITVAVIGLLGVLAAALIGNWDKLFPTRRPEGSLIEPHDTSGPKGRAALVFDFLAEAPAARWRNGSGSVLPWPGRRDDPRGFAVYVHQELLEDGSQPLNALETHPEWKDSGQIVGDFQLRDEIHTGDRFHAMVGFLKGAGGEVQFVVEAYGGALAVARQVSSLRDSGNDGVLQPIDEDLTPVTGARAMRLIVNAEATAAQDWAIWVRPRIEHQMGRE